MPLDQPTAERFARLALDCVHREYPNKIAHTLQSDADVRPPRELTPAFYGCYDWHSAVHGHWMLARLARFFPNTPLAEQARAALARSITPENIAAEVRYLEAPGRAAFERPYGLAWLLQLSAELRVSKSPLAHVLEPLETAAAKKLEDWLPKLPYPDRSGQHANTAFALGLMLDWARLVGHGREKLPFASAVRFYNGGPQWPDRLRTVRRRFPLAVPGRSRPDAPRLHAAGVRRMADRVPAGYSDAAAGRIAGSERRQTGALRRPESEPRLDALRHRQRTAR